ncbi:virulence-associated V antigen [Pseudomonas sp. MWU13-3659]|uniref:virulence-associated V antigen n=1 Tax=Pseudomonas sp. MWU13-3659 TaxID=2986964 RepID=UPI002075EB14|nr:virulence-associated V antigen [Pseudomonas sp. MWU13-3659]
MSVTHIVSRQPMLSDVRDSMGVMNKQGDIDALVKYIDEQKWLVVDDQGQPLEDTQRRSALAYLLGAAGQAELEKNRSAFNALLPEQLSSQPVVAIKQLLDARASWLPGAPVNLKQLMARITADSRDIDALIKYIQANKLTILDAQSRPLDEAGQRRVMEQMFSDVGLAALAQARKDFDGLLPARLSDKPLQAYQQMLDAWSSLLPGVPVLLERLPAQLRTDSMVFMALKVRLGGQDKDRGKMRDELLGQTGEMNIYSVIQAKINLRMGDSDENKRKVNIEDRDFNLFSAASYGFTEEKWQKSGERRLLMGLDTFEKNGKGFMSVRDFLEGATVNSGGKEVVTKISGPMKSADLKSEYAWAKDNNPLGNFSQALSDRSKVVSDKINELTTILNDKGNQYNTTIEIMMKFIDKWFSTLSKILS